MHRASYAAAVVMLLAAGCRDTSILEPVSQSATRALRSQAAELPGEDAGRRFWRSRQPADVWANLVRGDTIAVVGLREVGKERGVEKGRVVVSLTDRGKGKQELASHPGLTVIGEDERLPILRVKVGTFGALVALMASPYVDYVEPEVDFEVPWRNFFQSSGCGNDAWGGSMQTIEPGDILPVTFPAMWIPAAWGRSNGSGITIGLVDTGIDPGQPQLNEEFDDGMSAGRTINMLGFGDTWTDYCGHGTHMASSVAGPRDGRNTMGVAWGANLLVARVNGNPVLDGTNVTDTRMGIGAAATHSRIILMAFGSPNPWQSVADEIGYWYHNHDRLFVGAAGTSPFTGMGVLFPASEVTVTAVSGTNCGDCHYGTKVDFVTPQGMPAAGLRTTCMDNCFPHDISSSSSSSNSTAVIGGIAALVWSRNPSWTRQMVLSTMIYSASPTGYRHWESGWGVPNAFCAVGGWCMQWVDGPSLVEETRTYTFTAQQIGEGPFTYLWDSGETTQSKERFIQITYATVEHVEQEWVTITHATTGESRRVAREFLVRQPYPGCPECW